MHSLGLTAFLVKDIQVFGLGELEARVLVIWNSWDYTEWPDMLL